jgi:hypothetical protein
MAFLHVEEKNSQPLQASYLFCEEQPQKRLSFKNLTIHLKIYQTIA